ncbi:MAG: endonuclease [Pseudomonadota bacterium]
MAPAALHRVFDRLFDAYGRQEWWPADSRLEVMLGAVLTQNTSWINVEHALRRLKSAAVMRPGVLLDLGEDRLADLIRPAGYYRVKARRLRNLLDALQRQGGEPAWERLETEELRRRLLAVNGVGPETADDILLYAFHRPVFVVDAYTRRLFSRLDWVSGDAGYETLRHAVQAAARADTDSGFFQELHALIVHHAKRHCAVKPRCAGCALRNLCAFRDPPG